MHGHAQDTPAGVSRLGRIARELARHVPFTATGTLTGLALLVAVALLRFDAGTGETLFRILHPAHVLVSAWATAAMFRFHRPGRLLETIVVGYLGAIVIGTVSDSVIPHLGELLLGLEGGHEHGHEHAHGGLHIGFIEDWYIVNPLALLGVTLGLLRPRTKLPHFGHVLLSTWASLFHMVMAGAAVLDPGTILVVGVFLFLAVWLPCCASDIAFPLLFVGATPCCGPGHTHRHSGQK
jgi:hypothetical protein